jgi:hypothetical protein
MFIFDYYILTEIIDLITFTNKLICSKILRIRAQTNIFIY